MVEGVDKAKRLCIDHTNAKKQSALMVACKHGHADCVEYLATNGADPLVADERRGNTCLHFAVLYGHSDCVDKLLGSRVLAVAEQGRQPLVAQLPCRDEDGREVAFINCHNGWGLTALHVAVLQGSVNTVRALIRHGAALDSVITPARVENSPIRCSVGSNVLHIAAVIGNVTMAKVILEAQESVAGLELRSLVDAAGLRPCDYAARARNPVLVHLLDERLPVSLLRQIWVNYSLEQSMPSRHQTLSAMLQKLKLMFNLEIIAVQRNLAASPGQGDEQLLALVGAGGGAVRGHGTATPGTAVAAGAAVSGAAACAGLGAGPGANLALLFARRPAAGAADAVLRLQPSAPQQQQQLVLAAEDVTAALAAAQQRALWLRRNDEVSVLLGTVTQLHTQLQALCKRAEEASEGSEHWPSGGSSTQHEAVLDFILSTLITPRTVSAIIHAAKKLVCSNVMAIIAASPGSGSPPMAPSEMEVQQGIALLTTALRAVETCLQAVAHLTSPGAMAAAAAAQPGQGQAQAQGLPQAGADGSASQLLQSATSIGTASLATANGSTGGPAPGGAAAGAVAGGGSAAVASVHAYNSGTLSSSAPTGQAQGPASTPSSSFTGATARGTMGSARAPSVTSTTVTEGAALQLDAQLQQQTQTQAQAGAAAAGAGPAGAVALPPPFQLLLATTGQQQQGHQLAAAGAAGAGAGVLGGAPGPESIGNPLLSPNWSTQLHTLIAQLQWDIGVQRHRRRRQHAAQQAARAAAAAAAAAAAQAIAQDTQGTPGAIGAGAVAAGSAAGEAAPGMVTGIASGLLYPHPWPASDAAPGAAARAGAAAAPGAAAAATAATAATAAAPGAPSAHAIGRHVVGAHVASAHAVSALGSLSQRLRWQRSGASQAMPQASAGLLQGMAAAVLEARRGTEPQAQVARAGAQAQGAVASDGVGVSPTYGTEGAAVVRTSPGSAAGRVLEAEGGMEQTEAGGEAVGVQAGATLPGAAAEIMPRMDSRGVGAAAASPCSCSPRDGGGSAPVAGGAVHSPRMGSGGAAVAAAPGGDGAGSKRSCGSDQGLMVSHLGELSEDLSAGEEEHGSLWSDDDSTLCSICMDQPVAVQVSGCQHGLCVQCAFQLTVKGRELPSCPFCRQKIPAFEARQVEAPAAVGAGAAGPELGAGARVMAASGKSLGSSLRSAA